VVGRADLADVVQESGEGELFELPVIESHPATDGRRVPSDPPRVPEDVIIFRLKRIGNGTQEPARHLFQTRNKPLIGEG
jgi:hypothetical protein